MNRVTTSGVRSWGLLVSTASRATSVTGTVTTSLTLALATPVHRAACRPLTLAASIHRALSRASTWTTTIHRTTSLTLSLAASVHRTKSWTRTSPRATAGSRPAPGTGRLQCPALLPQGVKLLGQFGDLLFVGFLRRAGLHQRRHRLEDLCPHFVGGRLLGLGRRLLLRRGFGRLAVLGPTGRRDAPCERQGHYENRSAHHNFLLSLGVVLPCKTCTSPRRQLEPFCSAGLPFRRNAAVKRARWRRWQKPICNPDAKRHGSAARRGTMAQLGSRAMRWRRSGNWASIHRSASVACGKRPSTPHTTAARAE